MAWWVAAAKAAPAVISAASSLFGSGKKGPSIAPESQLEGMATEGITTDYSAIRDLVGAGAGQSDVEAGLQSQRGLADLLNSYAQGGFLPGESDIATANQYTSDIFGVQQTALNQSFEDAQTQANRQAAAMGRPVNDPILQAKLAQSQAREQQLLSAQQTAFAADYAQNLPTQRLQYAAQGADVSQNLAQQAMQNRSTLLGLGQGIQQNERNFRLNAAGLQGSGVSDIERAGGFSASIGSLVNSFGLGSGSSNNNNTSGGSSTGSTTSAAGGLARSVPSISSGSAVPSYLQPNSTYQAPTQSFNTPGLGNVMDFFSGATNNLGNLFGGN